jgi:predicted DNA-binding ribbon-helix-helix protein
MLNPLGLILDFGVKMARPELLTTYQRKFIVEIKLQAMAENRRLTATDVIREVKENFIDERVSSTAIIKFLTKINDRFKKLLDKPWNTATLNIATLNAEHLSPSSIPWLIGLQVHRKSCYSKPMTILEAKWFNRLFNFRDIFSSMPGIVSIGIEEKLKHSLVIATWAQMYAYREKIDTIAGIKEPNYSDLDNAIISGKSHETFKHNYERVNDEVARVFNNDNATKDDYKKMYFGYLKPAIFENIRDMEASVLGHSLGDPDLPENSTILYGNVLGILLTEENWGKNLEEINYQQKLHLLRLVREWCKNKPNLKPDFDYSNPDMKGKIDSILSNILENVKRMVLNERSN